MITLLTFRLKSLALLGVLSLATAMTAIAAPPDEITFCGPASSPISAAVAVPAGRALFMTSGTIPPVVDESIPAGSTARFGDTKTQGIGVLRAIESRLKEAGLGLKDVIYLRVYVAADKLREGKFDYPGWFEAYAQFFGTKENPVKPARSTVGVAGLVNPDWLIEIEAVAVYPTPGVPSTSKTQSTPNGDTPAAAPPDK